jgi:hypothetical protein
MKIKNNEWKIIEDTITTLTITYDPMSIKILLDLGYDDLTTNEELSELDLYDALQAVFLDLIETAFQEERYELIAKINKAHQKQAIIMKRAIDEMMLSEDEREEDFWHLHYTNEYFQITQQNLAEKNAK